MSNQNNPSLRNIKKDELTLPRATMNKMIEEKLPSGVRISCETRELILNYSTEFIHLLTSRANKVCSQSHKKTINAEHVLTGSRTDEQFRPLEVGDVLTSRNNRYEVLKFLGEGTFGHVVKCLKDANELVAIKMIKSRGSGAKEAKHEENVLGWLGQENADQFNVVRLYGSFVYLDRHCLVFEMLGESLEDFVQRQQYRPMSLSYIRPIIAQVLTALRKFKEIGLIHADLKPDNIMMVDQINQPFRVKVIDFGCGMYEPDTIQIPYIQTRFYRSPEIILGLPFCEAIDMWSLGCIAAELFLGFPLYPGSSEYDQLRYIVDVQGLPTSIMLRNAMKTDNFFCRASIGSRLSFRTPENYQEKTGIKSKETRRHIFGSLDEIAKKISAPSGLTDRELLAEEVDRKEFVDLLKGMLTMDQERRTTPSAALKHVFIKMTHFRNYGDCLKVQSGVRLMKLRCPNQYDTRATGSTSLCTLL